MSLVKSILVKAGRITITIILILTIVRTTRVVIILVRFYLTFLVITTLYVLYRLAIKLIAREYNR